MRISRSRNYPSPSSDRNRRLFNFIIAAVHLIGTLFGKGRHSICHLSAYCLFLAAMAGAASLLAPTATANTQTDSLPQGKTYYWAIPEQKLVGPVLRSSSSLELKFLGREDRGLDEIEQQSLAYPQTIQAIMLDSTESAIACARSWLQPLHTLDRCGQPAGFFRNILFRDTSRVTSPPHWTTLWDVARYPGQRTFFRGPRMTLEIALLADNVPPSKIYAELSTNAGIDRAFHKLNQLRPYIVWWHSPTDAQRILQRQTVLMGVIPGAIILSPQTKDTLTRPYQPDMNHILYSPAVWGIPATLPPEKTDETRAILLRNPPHLPYLPDTLPAESLEISDNFWATHALLLSERFNAWLTRSTPPCHSSSMPSMMETPQR